MAEVSSCLASRTAHVDRRDIVIVEQLPQVLLTAIISSATSLSSGVPRRRSTMLIRRFPRDPRRGRRSQGVQAPKRMFQRPRSSAPANFQSVFSSRE